MPKLRRDTEKNSHAFKILSILKQEHSPRAKCYFWKFTAHFGPDKLPDVNRRSMHLSLDPKPLKSMRAFPLISMSFGSHP